MLTFPKSLKEVEALFVLGNYMEMVDKSTRASNWELFVGSVMGQLVAKVAVLGSRTILNYIVIQTLLTNT